MEIVQRNGKRETKGGENSVEENGTE